MDLTRIASMLYSLPALLIGVVVHEYAHGWVAEKMGDPTARHAGRLTFNPLPHLDPFGSVLLPLLLLLSGSPVLFAAAKPVPVNPAYFRHGRRDYFWVGIAGPLSNLAVAFVAGLLVAAFWNVMPLTALRLVERIILVNCMLAVFNLIPLPPLDGSHLVEAFIPARWVHGYMSIAPFGIFIIFGLFFFVPGFFSNLILPAVEFLSAFFISWPLILSRMIGI